MLTSLHEEKEQRSLHSMDELLSDFEKTLIDSLKAPEKNVIGSLTAMVEGFLSHKDSASICLNVCKIIERRLNEVQVNRKLAHLYLMDSIIKNLKSSQYPKLFSANLVNSFAGVFRKGDEKLRKKMFELRKTWHEHFSPALLHSLDTQVKEIDPAWPVLSGAPAAVAVPPQQQPEGHAAEQLATTRKRSHPPDSPDSTTTPAGPGANPTNGNSNGESSLSRAKRPTTAALGPPPPPPQQTQQQQQSSDFVIDTVGDPMVEALAVRAGRSHETQVDVDMRRSWSQYKRTHSEQFAAAQPQTDVDMRQFLTDGQAHSGGESTPAELISQQQAQLRRVLAGANLKPETRQQIANCLKTLDSELAELHQHSRQPQPPAQHQPASQIPQHVNVLLDALLGSADGSDQLGSGGFEQAALPAAAPAQARPAAHAMPHQQQQPQEPAYKDLFRWRVTIPGMPEFPQIGCDPRLLSPLRDRFEASRSIQIDGEIRQVVLDRVQPLLILEEQTRALRFKMPPGGRILLRVDAHQPVELRINSYTKVFFGLRPHFVCLGGPFHELIVSGRPYNVSFNDPSPVHIVLGGPGGGVGGARFGVRLQALMPNTNRAVTPSLDICPPIPRSVLRWANEGAFGSLQQLHRYPMNPEHSQYQQHQQHSQLRSQEDPGYPQQMQQQPQPLPPVPSSVPTPPASTSESQAVPQQPPVSTNVFEVFQNLIRHGIIKKTKAEDAPEPDLTGFQGTDKPLPMIPKRLYSGFQCTQCGLRFNDEESADCRGHMDWHYQRRAAMFGQTIRSRLWFPHWTALVKGDEPAEGPAGGAAVWGGASAGSAAAGSVSVTAAAASSGDRTKQQSSRVPAYPEPDRNICGVCFETFENRWDDESEDWMLQDCVRLPDGGIYHPICAEDAGKVKLEDDDLPTASVADDSDMPDDGPAETDAATPVPDPEQDPDGEQLANAAAPVVMTTCSVATDVEQLADVKLELDTAEDPGNSDAAADVSDAATEPCQPAEVKLEPDSEEPANSELAATAAPDEVDDSMSNAACAAGDAPALA